MFFPFTPVFPTDGVGAHGMVLLYPDRLSFFVRLLNVIEIGALEVRGDNIPKTAVPFPTTLLPIQPYPFPPLKRCC